MHLNSYSSQVSEVLQSSREDVEGCFASRYSVNEIQLPVRLRGAGFELVLFGSYWDAIHSRFEYSICPTEHHSLTLTLPVPIPWYSKLHANLMIRGQCRSHLIQT